jgi:glycosyltransferase involved in cell wall biosynthesis
MIRSRIATFIVYQSNFTKEWWKRVYGETLASNTVIHNGVDLDFFKPDNNQSLAQDSMRFLMIEGGFGGGYEFGLEVAVKAVKELIQHYHHKVDFMLAGKISSSLQENVKRQFQDELSNGRLKVKWLGVVSHDEIPKLHQSAHFLFASDINAACPNTVVEAMASGLPVVSYNTGAIKELVKGNAGVVVPYGGDPWKLEQPDIYGLTEAMDEVYRNQSLYRLAARQLAVQEFGLKKMVQSYLEVLLN